MTAPSLVTSSIKQMLAGDPIWAAYALADTQPKYAHHSRWSLADDGLVQLFFGLTPPILFAAGGRDGVAAALKRAQRPKRVYLSVRSQHLPAIEEFYRVEDPIPMLRMYYPASAPGPSAADGVEHLGPEAADELLALYAHGGSFAPDSFNPSQLEDGTFHAVRGRAGQLVAAGGTHVVSQADGVAAIGNIYTHPEHRGQGYAQAVTAAIVDRLRSRQIAHIVLNVDARNLAAQKLYTKLGFRIHCQYVEGSARQ